MAHNQVLLINIKQQERNINKISPILKKTVLKNFTKRQTNRLRNNRIHDMVLLIKLYFQWLDSSNAKYITLLELEKIIENAQNLPTEITDSIFFKDIIDILKLLTIK